MRFILTAIVSVILTTAWSQSVHAGSYSVTLQNFGFNRSDCKTDIAAVAQAFANDANVAILSSHCLPPRAGDAFASGEFTYLAKAALKTTTSDIREPWGIEGHYHSMADCELKREFEYDVFARVTGLRPYVSYCYQANTIGAPRFRVRLDAVGVSSIRKHSTSASWTYRAEHEHELISRVRSLIEGIGASIITAATDHHSSGSRVTVDYYHDKKFLLHSQELLNWPSIEGCRTSASGIEKQWPSETIKSVFHCTHGIDGASRLLQIYLSENPLSGFDFKTQVYSTDYTSESSCISDASRIRAALEETGSIVLGIICGQDSSMRSWQMAAFYQSHLHAGI